MIPFRLPRLFLKSVRGRLAALILAIILPTIVLVGVVTKRGYDNERAAVGMRLLSTARAIATLVERKFDAAEALLRGLESLSSLEQDDIPRFEARVRAAAAGANQWIVLIRPDGQQVINTLLLPGTPPPKATVEPEFWEQLRRGERHVSDVIMGPAAKGPVLTVSVPVFSKGELKYGLTVAMHPSELARATAVSEIASNDVVAIVDRNGIIAARNLLAHEFVGRQAAQALTDEAAKAPEGVFEGVTLDGMRAVTAYTHCPMIGWVVAIGAPTGELYASARDVLWLAAGWSALLVGSAALIALWIGQAVVRGMESLVADTERIGMGRTPEGRPTGLHELDLVGSALKQTAERLSQRERELMQLNATLEQRVANRTWELDVANAKLLSANRELEDFARIASHDLREPLRSMSAFADILHEENGPQLDANGRGYLERVRASAARLSALLEAILAYSKVSNAPMAALADIDLKRAVADVEQDLAHRLADSGGRIETGTLGMVRGDRRQFHQLLLNLVGNALKFHRPGVPPVVRVESREEHGMVHLLVSDNGIGFDEAAAERIFAPFERLDRGYEGTGFGLAIVRRIAERHGGTVRATSTKGLGSRFDVMVPARPASGGSQSATDRLVSAV